MTTGTERTLNRDRPTSNPGGCECMECGCIFIGGPDHDYCRVCEENRNESAYERSLSECYRGDEYAASVVRELAEARKLK